jgi:hypothetical protein
VLSGDAIFSGDRATFQSCADFFSVFPPRNSVAFNGKLVPVAVLHLIEVPRSVATILIPRSIRRISGHVFSCRSSLKSLVFEPWSELKLISSSLFGNAHFNVFLFLNLSILWVQGYFLVVNLSLVFILIVIHPSRN